MRIFVNSILVFLIVGWAVWYMVRKFRSAARGETCCKGGCAGCPSAAGCTMKKRS